MFLSALAKNLNSENLAKNLVIFSFNVMGVHWKTIFLWGKGVHKLKGGS